MSNITESEARMVIKLMAKVQDATLDYVLSRCSDDYMLIVELIGLSNAINAVVERNRRATPGTAQKIRSKTVNNFDADLIIDVDTQVEQVDDMLAVTSEVILKPGVIKVKVFHHDAAERLVGVRHVEYGDIVVSIRGSVKLIYTSTEICQSCGTPLDATDQIMKRCMCCGSPTL